MAEVPAPTPPAHAPAAAAAAAAPPSSAASAATAALLLRLLPPQTSGAGGEATATTAAAAAGTGSGRDEAATATAAATAVPMRWSRAELEALAGKADPSCVPAPGADPTAYEVAFSKYNPTPGTGRTGFLAVPPNNYPFYSEGEAGGAGGEKYVPVLQPDGGQLSEWEPMYAPSKEQAEADRAAAYAAGVPHGYVAPGASRRAAGAAGAGGEGEEEVLQLWVVSELHDDDEYGAQVDAATGRHSGGPFRVAVGARTRVEELRLLLRDAGGLLPALQRLSYAGKHLDDSQRTLQQ
ncbi:hypothetical protein HXX76_013174 [Chlamydomonas incerta]|uniref:Ubiquitin-like domain-containing protein n=1 Tax=Chlamydomonas incerta TaxID=51695 RepID=A0A835VUD5_CHLIN|nr:hypothetical protein HXX76_013174 [Chlamydomonas incerta]|eukprot:KAG2426193.1 hypothetical protein HXX76_013174 [Chlamydomonas incerta]